MDVNQLFTRMMLDAEPEAGRSSCACPQCRGPDSGSVSSSPTSMGAYPFPAGIGGGTCSCPECQIARRPSTFSNDVPRKPSTSSNNVPRQPSTSSNDACSCPECQSAPVPSGVTQIVVAIMGPAGCGKSSFVNSIKSRFAAPVSNGLSAGDPQIGYYIICIGKYEFHILDTPGLDDAAENCDDLVEILEDSMKNRFGLEPKLHGLIYLQPINSVRMTGSLLDGLQVVRRIINNGSMSNLMLGTTFWDTGEAQGVNKETSLKRNYWASLLQAGARTTRIAYREEDSVDVLMRIANNVPQAVRPPRSPGSASASSPTRDDALRERLRRDEAERQRVFELEQARLQEQQAEQQRAREAQARAMQEQAEREEAELARQIAESEAAVRAEEKEYRREVRKDKVKRGFKRVWDELSGTAHNRRVDEYLDYYKRNPIREGEFRPDGSYVVPESKYYTAYIQKPGAPPPMTIRADEAQVKMARMFGMKGF